MNQQVPSFVIYRSQSERWLDQFIMSGQLVPLIFGIVTFFVVLLTLLKLAAPLWAHSRHRRAVTFERLIMFIAASLGVLVTYLTW